MNTKSKQKQYPSTVAPRVNLRFPDGLREKISEVAKKNHRTMTDEIVSRLEKSLESDAKAEAVVNDEPMRAIMFASEGISQFLKVIVNSAMQSQINNGEIKIVDDEDGKG